MKKKNRAVIYARYSSHNQREESIEGQLRECNEYANANDYIIVNEYVDRAISGKTDNRPAFQSMIDDSYKNKFDYIIMYTIDRFARNRYDAAHYKSILKKNNVKLLYAKQPLPDTPESIILESVLEGFAEYYSENLSRGIKRGMKENALKGLSNGTLTLGLTINANQEFEIDPIGAKTVQMIFEMYSQGFSMAKITDILNEKGCKTSRGNKFTPNSLPKILRNRKYIGEYRYDDVVIENHIKPIVDKKLFYEVQDMLNKNRKSRARNKAKEVYLLTGKVFCGKCDATMIGESGTSHTKNVYRYYKCSNNKRKKTCDKKAERKDDLEKLVVTNTVNYVLNDENIKMIAENVIKLVNKDFNDKSLLSALQNDLKDTDKKINNLLLALEQGIITPTTKNRLQELEKEKENLQNRISIELNKKPFLTTNHIIYWLNEFKNGDIEDVNYQKRIIDTLVNSVFVYDDEIVIIFNTSNNNKIRVRSSDIKSSAPPCNEYPNYFIFINNVFGLRVSR